MDTQLQAERSPRSGHTGWRGRARRGRWMNRIWNLPAAADPPRRAPSDVIVVAATLLVGAFEARSSGLGWPLLRLALAAAFAGILLLRRRSPLPVLVAVAVVNLAANLALRIADHFLLVSGVMLAVAIYALVRWASGRDVLIGMGVVVGHAVVGAFLNPNWSLIGALLFYVSPVLLAVAVRPSSGARGSVWTRRWLQAGVVVLAVVAVFVTSGGGFVVDQFHSYVIRTRSPEAPAEWFVDDVTLRRAAAASRGTHDENGAFVHTVDYPYQLLAALESPSYSVEADVTVIDGEAYLQHDPKEAVGMPLLDFLEYAAIADFPIVKLDLKCDRVGPVIDEVQEAVERFRLDPTHVQFNANVFRGPGLETNVFGARTDLSFTDGMYNLIVMELETSDLVRIAKEFPESAIAISSITPTTDDEEYAPRPYTEEHLDEFLQAASEVREVNPDQPIVFVMRGDLAALTEPSILAALDEIGDLAAWWSLEVPPRPGEIELLERRGVDFLDERALGE